MMNIQDSTNVAVKEIALKGKGVFAKRNFLKGETVLIGHRICILPERNRHSIQVDFNLHILMDEPSVLLNHCCFPNTGVRNNEFGAYDFVALVDIAEGDEITFDYETTETAFAADFQFTCNFSKCRRKLCGFFHLPVELRNQYGDFIADYLKPKRYDLPYR
jgi:uncharacterized protein